MWSLTLRVHSHAPRSQLGRTKYEVRLLEVSKYIPPCSHQILHAKYQIEYIQENTLPFFRNRNVTFLYIHRNIVFLSGKIWKILKKKKRGFWWWGQTPFSCMTLFSPWTWIPANKKLGRWRELKTANIMEKAALWGVNHNMTCCYTVCTGFCCVFFFVITVAKNAWICCDFWKKNCDAICGSF